MSEELKASLFFGGMGLCILLWLAAIRNDAACVSWVAQGEYVYVSDWQEEHCEDIEIRLIPMGDYNP